MQLPLGFYKWSFEGGEFAVGILPNNVFYCSSYPVHGGVWNILPNAKNSVDAMNTTSSLVIDWKRYGVYEFPITSDDHGRIGPTHIHGRDLVLCGQCRGEQSNTSWRKMQFVREFTPLEKKLMGHGFGSVWDFSWSKGCFEVKFHFDSFHHFVCDLCPEHSHWDLSDNDAETGAVITIHWGRYGKQIIEYLNTHQKF
jgi:hypothetical protein